MQFNLSGVRSEIA